MNIRNAGTTKGKTMKASEIIAEAVAATVAKAMEAGMIKNDEDLQAAGRGAMYLVMTEHPALYAEYVEEVAGILGVAA